VLCKNKPICTSYVKKIVKIKGNIKRNKRKKPFLFAYFFVILCADKKRENASMGFKIALKSISHKYINNKN